MENQTKEEMNSTYSIISYPATQLPDSYVAFIFAKWLRSLRGGNPFFQKINSDDYYKNYHAFLEKIMEKPDSIIRLAVLSDDHDVALGFSVSREDVLDYVFVLKDYRRIGIAAKLVPAGITTFSHITLTAINIWQKNPKYEHLKFNPFA